MPTYAVANRSNEFILIASEVMAVQLACLHVHCALAECVEPALQDETGKATGKSVLLGFMCEADAHALRKRVRCWRVRMPALMQQSPGEQPQPERR